MFGNSSAHRAPQRRCILKVRQCALAISVLALIATKSVRAQSPFDAKPYPAMDLPMTLSSGHVWRVRNLVVLVSGGRKALTIFVETGDAVRDSATMLFDASALVREHPELQAGESLDRITVAVCRTEACIELRERPSDLWLFERLPAGGWVNRGRFTP